MPHKPIDTIVGLCASAVGAPDATVVTFLVFDDNASALFVRSIDGDTPVRPGAVPGNSEDSVSSSIRDTSGPVAISNLALGLDRLNTVERQVFEATAYLGAPVRGPVGEILGVLCAMRTHEHYWTRHQRRVICDFAFLLSEQILLRAALETVKLMARERNAHSACFTQRN